mgnify:CR=1 FL=1
MKVLRKKNINFSELFEKPELLAAEDLTEFINKLNSIYLSNEYLFKNSSPVPYGIPTIEKLCSLP